MYYVAGVDMREARDNHNNVISIWLLEVFVSWIFETFLPSLCCCCSSNACQVKTFQLADARNIECMQQCVDLCRKFSYGRV